MTEDLPYLNEERLNMFFDHFCDCLDLNCSNPFIENKKLYDFFEMLKAMQSFNFHHRPNDTTVLFPLFETKVFNFATNTDGPIVWLALILAIKELYGFSDEKLISVIKQITISNDYCCPVSQMKPRAEATE